MNVVSYNPFYQGNEKFSDAICPGIFKILDNYFELRIDKQATYIPFAWDNCIDPLDSNLPSTAAALIRHPKSRKTVQITILPRLIVNKQREHIHTIIHYAEDKPFDVDSNRFVQYSLSLFDATDIVKVRTMISGMLLGSWDWDTAKTDVRKRPVPEFILPTKVDSKPTNATRKTKSAAPKKREISSQMATLIAWANDQKKS